MKNKIMHGCICDIHFPKKLADGTSLPAGFGSVMEAFGRFTEFTECEKVGGRIHHIKYKNISYKGGRYRCAPSVSTLSVITRLNVKTIRKCINLVNQTGIAKVIKREGYADQLVFNLNWVNNPKIIDGFDLICHVLYGENSASIQEVPNPKMGGVPNPKTGGVPNPKTGDVIVNEVLDKELKVSSNKKGVATDVFKVKKKTKKMIGLANDICGYLINHRPDAELIHVDLATGYEVSEFLKINTEDYYEWKKNGKSKQEKPLTEQDRMQKNLKYLELRYSNLSADYRAFTEGHNINLTRASETFEELLQVVREFNKLGDKILKMPKDNHSKLIPDGIKCVGA